MRPTFLLLQRNKTYAHFYYWVSPSEKKQWVLWKEKEQRKEDPLQIRVCRFKSKESRSSPTFIQSSSMASGMVIYSIAQLGFLSISWDALLILDPWFQFNPHYRCIIFPTFGIRAMIRESIHLGFRNYEKLGFLINNS